MKVHFRHVEYSQEKSFAYYDKTFKQFDAPFHMHPEFELAWIENTTGKLFVGNNISNYTPNELLLIGPNVPHCWRSNIIGKKLKARTIVLHFKIDFLGEPFFQKPEMENIRRILEKSNKGLIVKGDKTEIITLLKDINHQADSFKQLMKLFNLLHLLSTKKEVKLLNKQSASESISHLDCERIDSVNTYILKKFKEEIKLEK